MHQTTEFSGRLVVALLLPALVLYCIMVFGPLAHLTELSQGRRPFDMMPGGYDEPYARAFLDALGTGGRAYYLKRQIPLDFIYPALFAAAFFALCNWLATKIVWSARALRWFGLLPLLAAAFDYAENLLIISILRGYPPAS